MRGSGAAAAADPGHRQCRRFHHADRIARRQHRFRQAAEHHRRRSSPTRSRRARCSASRRRSAPLAPQVRVEVDRVKAQTLHVPVDQVFSTLATYFGSTYVDAVQQIRPGLPGLCPGRCEVPAAAARHRQSVGAQRAGQHDPARHDGRRSTPIGRSAADQPLQSLSVVERASACRRPASVPARRCA